MAAPDITVSVVSHRQNGLVNQFLADVERVCAGRVALVVTENVPDPVPLETAALSCPVRRIANSDIRGFGANHNAAFANCQTTFFCVANPDVRLPADPFPRLIEQLQGKSVGVVGPLVRNPGGGIEDSARRFPTLGKLIGRRFQGNPGPDYPTDRGPVEVDWLAGMFLLMRSEAFRSVAGFDERYFLYYEDVDLCRRLGDSGRKAIYEPRAEVVHDARRASRRNLRLARLHLQSTVRFLLTAPRSSR